MKRFFPVGITAIVVLSFSIVSCVSTGKNAVSASVGADAPKWIEIPAAIYPNNTYIAQVGSAEDKESAELAAVQKIAALFGQNIQSASTASQRMEQAQKSGEVATLETASGLNQKIQRTIQQENLIGIKIAETWKDTIHNTWYALAVLNREETAQIYCSMLDKNNATIKNLCSKLKPATMYAYANMCFAIDIAEINKGYIERLFVIDSETGQKKAAETITPEALKIKAQELATEIPVYVKIENDKDKRITTAFEKSLSQLGFNSTAAKNASYTLTGSLLLNTTAPAAKDVFYSEFLVQCNLRDVVSQQNMCTWSLSGRNGSKTAENAENRTLTGVARKIEEIFAQELKNSLGKLPQ